jgi:hypothetical protein
VSKPNPKPEFPVGGCAGLSLPAAGGYHLRHLIAVLDAMSGRPAVAEIEAEPEDDRHWVRQAPGRPDFSREERLIHDRDRS